ncbi:MAG: hypothetical protein ACR2OB_13205 [Solirubrobacteraceae bacterium]
MIVRAEVPLLLLLAAELLLLHRGQRRLFWRLGGAGALRPFAYLAVMPGTVLHESSHALACRALGVPVGRTRLFRPRRRPDGSVLLGSVSHARTGPLRGALISAAPLVLVPAALAGVSAALLGPRVLGHFPHGLSTVPVWRLALWGWSSLSCAQAAFPSSGDHIGVLGALLIGLVLTILLVALSAAGGPGTLHRALAFATVLLALPAAVAAVALVVLRAR